MSCIQYTICFTTVRVKFGIDRSVGVRLLLRSFSSILRGHSFHVFTLRAGRKKTIFLVIRRCIMLISARPSRPDWRRWNVLIKTYKKNFWSEVGATADVHLNIGEIFIKTPLFIRCMKNICRDFLQSAWSVVN